MLHRKILGLIVLFWKQFNFFVKEMFSEEVLRCLLNLKWLFIIEEIFSSSSYLEFYFQLQISLREPCWLGPRAHLVQPSGSHRWHPDAFREFMNMDWKGVAFLRCWPLAFGFQTTNYQNSYVYNWILTLHLLQKNKQWLLKRCG